MNLPTDLLRTFVTISELGGFTQAGTALGRSQPAISLQIKRLEEMIGRPLLIRTGRKLKPTDQGELLLGYARRMLRLNDEAVSALIAPQMRGHVRLGIPNEFAISVLPTILARFSQTHPEVTLEVICDLSRNLLQALGEQRFDLVLAIHDQPDIEGHRAWTEEIVWVASPDHETHSDAPVPLIVAPQGCVYRQRIINTLSEHAIPWRIVYTSTSYGGTRAATIAGLGVTAVARSTVPNGLTIVPVSDRYPALAAAEVALHYDATDVTDVVARLVEFIASGIGPTASMGDSARGEPNANVGTGNYQEI